MGYAGKTPSIPVTSDCGVSHQEDKRQQVNDKNVEERENLCTDSENVNWCSHYGKHMEAPQKIKSTITYDPAISLLCIYPQEMKTGY